MPEHQSADYERRWALETLTYEGWTLAAHFANEATAVEHAKRQGYRRFRVLPEYQRTQNDGSGARGD